ncbi:MAG: S-layer homology domain-containing protein [Calditrichia bacterium]
MRRTYWVLLGFMLYLLLLMGCGGGQKARQAQSVVDSPGIHYDRGRTLLEQEKYNEAMFEFKQANSLDPKYAPAYEGMAWVYLEQDDLENAKKMADKALDLNGKWVLAKLVKARIKAKQGEYDDAIKEAQNAIKDVPKSDTPNKKQATVEGYMILGDIYREADRYNEAQDAYGQVLEIDKTNMRADRAIKELAEYKSAVAGQRPELRKIASQKQITRSDVAVLFVLELPLQKIFREAPKAQTAGWRAPTQPVMGQQESSASEKNVAPPDVPQDHWAHSFIIEALDKGVLELMPDGNFHPDEEVNRAEFARLIEKFLMRYYNDPSLETRFFGQTSPYADVHGTSPTFNAIMTVSTRGIMPGNDDGTFRPLGPVSGTEALNIIRNLKSKL